MDGVGDGLFWMRKLERLVFRMYVVVVLIQIFAEEEAL